jgi:hypothetical protein
MLTRRLALRLLACAVLLIVRAAPSAADDKAPAEEAWEAVFIGSDKVGHNHTITRNLWENGRELVEVRMESAMSMKRFGQTIDISGEYVSVETPEGKLLRLDNRTLEQRIRCEVAGDKMKVTLETPGQQKTTTIPWSNEVLGPNGEDTILKKEGLKPGRKRSFRTFNPELGLQIFTTTLYGEDFEDVALLDGSKKKLQRVRMEIDVPALKHIKTFAWVDETGESLKTHMDMLGGITTYTVSKEVAQAKPESISKDFGLATLVKPDKQIPKPYQATEVVYRIQIENDDPFEVFPQDDRQSLSKDDSGAVLLTIRAVDPSQPARAGVKEPGPEFLRSNNYLQSDDAKVIRAAKEAVGEAGDAWEKAKRLERWVFDKIAEKNFGRAFDSAAVVADKREGDCTEHGVLLAAMARVVGIPSRVACGLIYADGLSVFGYHMWAELYINGRWVPLDGTLGLGHASPTHIKIADSNLEGVDALSTFLPVARVMDRLKIEVVSWKHSDTN